MAHLINLYGAINLPLYRHCDHSHATLDKVDRARRRDGEIKDVIGSAALVECE